MKLPKKRRRVVTVEKPRQVRRMGQGSVAQRGSGGDGGGMHRRMNAIKSGGHHSHTNHTTPGGTYRLPNTPHDKMGKSGIPQGGKTSPFLYTTWRVIQGPR